MVVPYAGITTTLSSSIADAVTDQISILNIENLDLKIGDYLQIDDEIVRIKTTIQTSPTNPIYVFRGVLGSRSTPHAFGSLVRRVSVNPVELRRHSISRASGHTFEYVGFGPGNYSTAFPDKQDRQISAQEELLAQSTRKEGGINFYTGMNDRGISYSGNKKLSTVTGQEEIFDTPIQTITGEDISNIASLNVINPVEGTFSRSIRIEGGPDSKSLSEFNGPVIFSKKLTSTSEEGIEANSLYLQGDATISRNYTVGSAAPTLSGNPGDVVYYANPQKGGYLGWVYTTDNEWYRFGPISGDVNLNSAIFDKVGIATTSPGNCTFKVGSGTTLFCIDGTGVGIGTTANLFKLNVQGNVNIGGTVTALSFSGDGSGLTNLNIAASGWTNVSAGLGTGIYNSTLGRVGVGTSVPNYTLEVGSPGTATTGLYVNNKTVLAGFTTTADVTVGGMLTATSYNLRGGTGTINAGIVTAAILSVGTAGTVITTTSSQLVGIGTTAPRAKFDVEGHTRFKTYSENVETLTISSNNVNVDLSKAQTFELTVTSAVNQFTILNPPAGSTAFTIKITQDSTGYSVGIDTFKAQSGASIPVYWPGGGVVPIVTTSVNKTDIYSFKTFDSGSTLYGVVGGQNFA
jgi:hypothetical protein